SNIVEWRKAAPDQGVPAAILFSVSRSRPIDVPEQLRFLCYSRDWTAVPVVILSHPEWFNRFSAALPEQVRGHVPSTAGLEVLVEAIDLVVRGGALLPLFAVSRIRPANGTTFTAREHAVLAALRQGKSNKCIAYDLKMSESTVKVHVRNIMKKVGARNRTQ